MYCPLVGERVWVNDCLSVFIVTQTDYIASVACISPIEEDGNARIIPFSLLSAQPKLQSAQVVLSKQPSIWDVIRSSHECVKAAQTLMREVRDTIEETRVTIEVTKMLIERSDQLVSRARTLDCDRFFGRSDRREAHDLTAA